MMSILSLIIGLTFLALSLTAFGWLATPAKQDKETLPVEPIPFEGEEDHW
jgi:hypothetical protein